MKQLVIIIAILLMPISVICLQAQENKHAQAMHTTFVETLNGKLPKEIMVQWMPGIKDNSNVFWEALDGGGLVPKNKIHVVTLSKSKSNITASIGPLYLDGHRFEFRNVPDDPNLPLRHILSSFDKHSPYASCYYSYVAGDEQSVFPGINIAFGEDGQIFPLRLEPQRNVRVIGFKDDDGFRSTYLLSWMSSESDSIDNKHKYYDTDGIMYEFHCPKLAFKPQVQSFNPDEYLDRTNTALFVANKTVSHIQEKEPDLAKVLATDTLAEQFQYTFWRMAQKLYNSPETPNLSTSYEALKAKLQRMVELSRMATSTELQAICHTLIKELNGYPFQLSCRHAEELQRLTDTIAAVVPEEPKQQMSFARKDINTLRNLTADIDSLCTEDQEFLNRNFWNLSHQPVDYKQTRFISRGEHYSGDSQAGYFHVWCENNLGEINREFHAETKLKGLRPGRYRVSAVVRAEETSSGHSGIHIFAKTRNGVNEEMHCKELPPGGILGGNVWYSAYCRFKLHTGLRDGVYALDINKARANAGLGYGWNRIYIDDIIVRDGILTYGISTRPEFATNDGDMSAWFSACDFIVERVGD